MNGKRVIKVVAPLLLTTFGAMAVSTGAQAAVVRPADWFGTGVNFSSYYECADWGAKAVSTGNYYGWSCVPNGDGTYELWLDD